MLYPIYRSPLSRIWQFFVDYYILFVFRSSNPSPGLVKNILAILKMMYLNVV